MPTRDQQRAMMAFEHVKSVKTDDRDKYASMVHAMPTLLRSAGLSQALHFVHTRKHPGQKELLEHFAKQLARVDPTIKQGASLLDTVRKAELAAYLRLTQEALACATWYRRFVQGELGIEAGKDHE